MKMKTIMETFRRNMDEATYWENIPVEQHIANITTKIAQKGLADEVMNMDDDELSDLMSSVHDEYYDRTGEGWVPYPHDVEMARKNLSFEDEDDDYYYDHES